MFTFFCIMTSICLVAGLFFLFLQPVEPAEQVDQDGGQPQILEPDESANSFQGDIKETYMMLKNVRMFSLYPLMVSTALNQGILSSVFIKMMVDTMDDSTG